MRIIVLQHNLEVIKVEPDLDTESLSGSPFFEDPLTDETEDGDPLLIKSAVVKDEVKVSFLLMHTLCEVESADLVCYIQMY